MRKSVAIGLLLLWSAGLAACNGSPKLTTGLASEGILPPCHGTLVENCGGGGSSGGGSSGGSSSGGSSSGGSSSGGSSSGGSSSGGSSSGGSSSGADLASGDAAIALENSSYVVPTTAPTALGTLSYSNGTSTATVAVDPKAATTGWPASVTMNEYLPGTNDTANPNLGGTYREYRDISAAAGTDYELQVWNWSNSYGAQFRDNPNGGEADRQAWLYGGTRTTTAAMPNSGVANYSGEWGGTAKTGNWTGDTPVNTLDNNRLWMVRGTTSLAADFTAGTVTGTLTTDEWRTLDDNAMEVVDLPPADEDIHINTTITGNTFAGTATYGTTAVQGDNVAHGAFFGPAGPNPAEATGAFNVHATYVEPMGGDIPINDDRRGYMDISGVFNGAVAP
jgi:hypothetical protein